MRDIIFFDLETTGVDITKARIVSIALIKLNFETGEIQEHYTEINPTIPIPKEASDVHGITDEMVKDKKTFAEIAPKLANFFKGCNVAGYNSNAFDVPILVEEFLRAEVEIPFDNNTLFLDAFVIFRKKERRDLSAAVRFYLGRDMENAHNALADVKATKDVLFAQMERYRDIAATIEETAAYCDSDKKTADYAGKLYVGEDGLLYFTFGKHKDKPVVNHPEYADWMLQNDFPLYTKMLIKKELNL